VFGIWVKLSFSTECLQSSTSRGLVAKPTPPLPRSALVRGRSRGPHRHALQLPPRRPISPPLAPHASAKPRHRRRQPHSLLRARIHPAQPARLQTSEGRGRPRSRASSPHFPQAARHRCPARHRRRSMWRLGCSSTRQGWSRWRISTSSRPFRATRAAAGGAQRLLPTGFRRRAKCAVAEGPSSLAESRLMRIRGRQRSTSS
jgi:hypothetical protein